jgi:hypothetical protein
MSSKQFDFNFQQNLDFLDEDEGTNDGMTSNSNDNSMHSHSPSRTFDYSIFSPQSQQIDANRVNQPMISHFDQH